MVQKYIRLLVVAIASMFSPFAFSQAGPAINSSAHSIEKFEEKPHRHDVFLANKEGQSYFSYIYEPYLDWTSKGSGRFFPMEIAPVLTGMVNHSAPSISPVLIDESKYEDQAKEFAQVVNKRNKNGRPVLDLLGKSPVDSLKEVLNQTYVVEIVLSTTIDKPFSQLNLTAERVATMAEKVDVDHSHFQIPGSFALDALEQDHAALATIRAERNYLLSVFDLRDYGCDVMKNGVRDYFSREGEINKLQNESIYVISQIDLNLSEDFGRIEHYLGRRPDAVIQQQLLYADHLLRGGKSVFAFFAEGQKTRVVLISNLAMKSKYFTMGKGTLIRQYLLDGITGAGLVKVIGFKDKIDDLLSSASKDVNQKNSCSRGMALGLIRYEQSLFAEMLKFSFQ
jgi:hypothetical protein